MKQKTVYIIGAGFSMSAGAPSQSAIISEIFELEKVDFNRNTSKVKNWIKEFREFLEESLFLTPDERDYYTLEDIYTPIDRSIAEGISFRGYDLEKLQKLRDTFNRLIILAVRNSIEKSGKPKDSITHFAKHVAYLGKQRLYDAKDDRVAIITTNWDIMLDNAINQILINEPVKAGKFNGVVDYCCYISSLERDDEKIKPGLYALGKGGYNVKLIKLHGSLNWLQCPKCHRLYVKYFKTWNGGYVFGAKYCRHCDKNFETIKDSSNQLKISLIMPTFLKNLNNVQNKLMWQNAGIELSEASKVVFLGYSLPQADFEFKQLLSRMIRADAEIEVVLVEKDNPENYADKDKLKNDMQYQTAGYRYENFFSGRNPKITYKGIDAYISSLPTS